jgi:phenylpropionate dioxygenase-like ring-hydroxylating dioxygenase large terminal subunit
VDEQLSGRLRREMADERRRTSAPTEFPALPPVRVERYTSGEFFELERRHVWSRSWLLVAREEDFPKPGCFRVVDRLGTPILLVRGKDDRLRAFYNTCQHRGAPVVREKTGTASRLTCQFHSWTYDLTGKLVTVPFRRDFTCLDEARLGLKPLLCESYDGWVFVNRSADTPSLLQSLGPLANEWRTFSGKMLRAQPTGEQRIPCNWKVVADAFLETYHVRTVHTKTVGGSYDHAGCTIELFRYGHSRMATPKTEYGLTHELGPSPDDAAAVQPLPPIPGLDRLFDEASVAYHFFPNLIVSGNTLGIAFIMFWPVDVNTTDVTWNWFAPPAETPEQQESWVLAVEQFNVLMEEDFRNLAPMQTSIASGALASIPLCYQERRIYHYHEEIDRLVGPARMPPDMRVAMLLEPLIGQALG